MWPHLRSIGFTKATLMHREQKNIRIYSEKLKVSQQFILFRTVQAPVSTSQHSGQSCFSDIRGFKQYQSDRIIIGNDKCTKKCNSGPQLSRFMPFK